jgi:hypothetical protein
MVFREWSESDESESLSELLSELEESSQLAAGPGVASSSIMCWGVDSYRYACESNWKSRYTMYTRRRIYFKSACGHNNEVFAVGLLTTLVPRLTLRDCSSARALSLNEAWKAVYAC